MKRESGLGFRVYGFRRRESCGFRESVRVGRVEVRVRVSRVWDWKERGLGFKEGRERTGKGRSDSTLVSRQGREYSDNDDDLNGRGTREVHQ